MQTSFVEVIVPLALNNTFTYQLPDNNATVISVGSRVVVPFGPRKFYTAIVTAVNVAKPDGIEAKQIVQVLDAEPIVYRSQLQLWNWIADYYLCTIGDVYRAAVPSGLKLESETFVEINPDFVPEMASNLSDKSAEIVAFLKHNSKKISIGQLSKLTGINNPSLEITSLLENNCILVSEKLVERYRVVREAYVNLRACRTSGGETSRIFSMVKGARKQETALIALIELSGFNRPLAEPLKEVTRKALEQRAGITPAITLAMQKRGLIDIYYKEKSRFSYSGLTSQPLPSLSSEQNEALQSIHISWTEHDVTLLHGVTSSGKTEIYLHLIDFAMRQGKQVLFLVPEIALTTQLTTRLQRVFGEKVIIYHSKFSDSERVEIWRKVLHHKEPCVIIGARSAIFLPFSVLGLIIVDEEHETSYKQQDPAPRYNARDTAMVLARMFGAKTLLASATPSVDTYYKATSGRYGLVTLSQRYGGIEMPEVEVVDMNRERKNGSIKGIFSLRMQQAVNNVIENGAQAIIFLNRRGYAPVAECPHCAYVAKCTDCDVSLTYHRGIGRLVCHYCGSEYTLPSICPVCHEPGMKVQGFGTERLEEDLAESFPDRVICRMDLDTTRAKDGYDNIIDSFSQGKSQILIGTQMVTKGLDFDRVRLVGVVNADSMINMPDFRAGERAFNMLEQVAGRAGRRDSRGLVIIQTRQPEHPLIKAVVDHDYIANYRREIDERHRYNYPPFTRLIVIYLRHRDMSVAASLANEYASRLRTLFGNRVNGPEQPDVPRVQNMHIRKIMLKFELGVSLPRVRQLLRDTYIQMHTEKVNGIRQSIISYDVDPY